MESYEIHCDALSLPVYMDMGLKPGLLLRVRCWQKDGMGGVSWEHGRRTGRQDEHPQRGECFPSLTPTPPPHTRTHLHTHTLT